jgi:hypothetical protein
MGIEVRSAVGQWDHFASFMFEAHGFERVLQTTGRRGGKRRWLVRRKLA